MSHCAAPIAETIRQRLSALSPRRLDLTDESHRHKGHAGARQGGHYALHIVSPCFAGLSTLARHRLIHQQLGELMQQGIHALTIRAQTPEEV